MRSEERNERQQEWTERDIPLLYGTAFDMPGDATNLIHRSLMDWYITKTEGSDGNFVEIRHDIEPLDEQFFQKSLQQPYYLHGRLLLSANPSTKSRSLPKSIPLRIKLDGRWALDRSHEHRGIWVQTDIAWYWLKRPCSLRSTVRLRIKGIPDLSLEATIPSQEDLHTVLRAKLGLVSNWCDLLLFDENDPDSRTLLKRHSRHRAEQIYEELSPGPELLERYPDRSHEPFDGTLQFKVPGVSSFVQSHLFGWYLDTESVLFNSFKEPPSTKQPTAFSVMMTENIKWWKESAKSSETRSARYPWGEPLPGVQRINPNWVFSARLALAAEALSRAPPQPNEDDDDDDEIVFLGTIQTNVTHSSSKSSNKIRKKTTKSTKLLKQKRKRKLAETNNTNLNDSDSDTPNSSQTTRRNLDEEVDFDNTVGNSPPLSPQQNAKSKTKKILVVEDNDSVSSLIHIPKSKRNKKAKHALTKSVHDVNTVNVSGTKRTISSEQSKTSKKRRVLVYDESDEDDDNAEIPEFTRPKNSDKKSISAKQAARYFDDDDDDDSDSIIIVEKESLKPKPTAFQRLEEITLGKTMYQPQRMLASLNDMKDFLIPQEMPNCESLETIKKSGYAFRSFQLAEDFVRLKMRTGAVSTWEYKILVTLACVGMYHTNENPRNFEIVIFDKGKSKRDTPAIRIIIEEWKSEAIRVIQNWEQAFTSEHRHQGKASEIENPLKRSLLPEFLLEVCRFCRELRILEKKSAWEKIKDPEKFGLDLESIIEETRKIGQALEHGRLVHESNLTVTRLRHICLIEHSKKSSKDLGSKQDIPLNREGSNSTRPVVPDDTKKKLQREERIRSINASTAGVTSTPLKRPDSMLTQTKEAVSTLSGAWGSSRASWGSQNVSKIVTPQAMNNNWQESGRGDISSTTNSLSTQKHNNTQYVESIGMKKPGWNSSSTSWGTSKVSSSSSQSNRELLSMESDFKPSTSSSTGWGAKSSTWGATGISAQTTGASKLLSESQRESLKDYSYSKTNLSYKPDLGSHSSSWGAARSSDNTFTGTENAISLSLPNRESWDKESTVNLNSSSIVSWSASSSRPKMNVWGASGKAALSLESLKAAQKNNSTTKTGAPSSKLNTLPQDEISSNKTEPSKSVRTSMRDQESGSSSATNLRWGQSTSSWSSTRTIGSTTLEKRVSMNPAKAITSVTSVSRHVSPNRQEDIDKVSRHSDAGCALNLKNTSGSESTMDSINLVKPLHPFKHGTQGFGDRKTSWAAGSSKKEDSCNPSQQVISLTSWGQRKSSWSGSISIENGSDHAEIDRRTSWEAGSSKKVDSCNPSQQVTSRTSWGQSKPSCGSNVSRENGSDHAEIDRKASRAAESSKKEDSCNPSQQVISQTSWGQSKSSWSGSISKENGSDHTEVDRRTSWAAESSKKVDSFNPSQQVLTRTSWGQSKPSWGSNVSTENGSDHAEVDRKASRAAENSKKVDSCNPSQQVISQTSWGQSKSSWSGNISKRNGSDHAEVDQRTSWAAESSKKEDSCNPSQQVIPRTSCGKSIPSWGQTTSSSSNSASNENVSNHAEVVRKASWAAESSKKENSCNPSQQVISRTSWGQTKPSWSSNVSKENGSDEAEVEINTTELLQRSNRTSGWGTAHSPWGSVKPNKPEFQNTRCNPGSRAESNPFSPISYIINKPMHIENCSNQISTRTDSKEAGKIVNMKPWGFSSSSWSANTNSSTLNADFNNSKDLKFCQNAITACHKDMKMIPGHNSNSKAIQGETFHQSKSGLVGSRALDPPKSWEDSAISVLGLESNLSALSRPLASSTSKVAWRKSSSTWSGVGQGSTSSERYAQNSMIHLQWAASNKISEKGNQRKSFKNAKSTASPDFLPNQSLEVKGRSDNSVLSQDSSNNTRLHHGEFSGFVHQSHQEEKNGADADHKLSYQRRILYSSDKAKEDNARIGFGRGSHVNKPSWMKVNPVTHNMENSSRNVNLQIASQEKFDVNQGECSKSSKPSIPNQVHGSYSPFSINGHDSQTTKSAFHSASKQQNSIPYSHDVSVREENVVAGRGRGRSMTLPAWMTKR